MERFGCDTIKLVWNSSQLDNMEKHISDLFEYLKSPETGEVDLTELKAYFARMNVQNENPTLFKKVNDLAL
jgi:hypothetical protein